MHLIYKCKQAQQMVSEGLDRELSFAERARLKLHLSICDSCTNFNTQMQTLRLAMRKLRSDSIDSKEQTK
ncbi:zf-HC2 domain-containing protein [Undibacterium sp. Ren11W]|uniref:zf-HC2 domain-containing protein n=1 Tax=Undibacterium sp. Ren11W TaxID=3413045 RepID=UPI003BF1D643